MAKEKEYRKFQIKYIVKAIVYEEVVAETFEKAKEMADKTMKGAIFIDRLEIIDENQNGVRRFTASASNTRLAMTASMKATIALLAFIIVCAVLWQIIDIAYTLFGLYGVMAIAVIPPLVLVWRFFRDEFQDS